LLQEKPLTDNDPLLQKTRRKPQARGIARRKKLVQAAKELLKHCELENISLADVAKHVNIPVPSIYALYPKLNDIFAQVLAEYDHELVNELNDILKPATTNSWLDVIYDALDHRLEYFKRNPVYLKLRLGGAVPSEIRYSDARLSGINFASKLSSLVSKLYVIPNMPQDDLHWIVSLDLMEGILSSAYIREGELSEVTVEEAKRALVAYLKLYIPEYIPRRARL
jgi:AcrR family transcriptional regulator